MPFFRCAGQWVMVVRLDSTRSLNLGEVREFLCCFAFLASMPGLHRQKCKACQEDNHFKVSAHELRYTAPALATNFPWLQIEDWALLTIIHGQ